MTKWSGGAVVAPARYITTEMSKIAEFGNFEIRVHLTGVSVVPQVVIR